VPVSKKRNLLRRAGYTQKRGLPRRGTTPQTIGGFALKTTMKIRLKFVIFLIICVLYDERLVSQGKWRNFGKSEC
jgi:hypothetical protein